MKVLVIDATFGEISRTKSLLEHFLLRYPKDDLERVELMNMDLSPLNKNRLDQRNQWIEKSDYRDEMFSLAKQWKEADQIVVAAPYWDLTFPAVVKIYIENIMVNGLTFCYTDRGPRGLCKGQKLTYISTVGGYAGDNLGFQYVKQIGASLGIEKAECILAEGLDVLENNPQAILEEVIEKMNE